jgi:hypothetical protein
MHEDKSIARFMSYLSLFTFFMLILVTADNFLQLFVVHNYNQVKTIVNFTFPKVGDYFDGFTGSAIQVNGTECKLEMGPRSRIWIRTSKK